MDEEQAREKAEADAETKRAKKEIDENFKKQVKALEMQVKALQMQKLQAITALAEKATKRKDDIHAKRIPRTEHFKRLFEAAQELPWLSRTIDDVPVLPEGAQHKERCNASVEVRVLIKNSLQSLLQQVHKLLKFLKPCDEAWQQKTCYKWAQDKAQGKEGAIAAVVELLDRGIVAPREDHDASPRYRKARKDLVLVLTEVDRLHGLCTNLAVDPEHLNEGEDACPTWLCADEGGARRLLVELLQCAKTHDSTVMRVLEEARSSSPLAAMSVLKLCSALGHGPVVLRRQLKALIEKEMSGYDRRVQEGEGRPKLLRTVPDCFQSEHGAPVVPKNAAPSRCAFEMYLAIFYHGSRVVGSTVTHELLDGGCMADVCGRGIVEMPLDEELASCWPLRDSVAIAEQLMRLTMLAAKAPQQGVLEMLLVVLDVVPAADRTLMADDVSTLRRMCWELGTGLIERIETPPRGQSALAPRGQSALVLPPTWSEYGVLWCVLERIWTLAEKLGPGLEDRGLPTLELQRRFLMAWRRQDDKDDDQVLRMRIAMLLPRSNRSSVLTPQGNQQDVYRLCHQDAGIAPWLIHAVHSLVPHSVKSTKAYDRWRRWGHQGLQRGLPASPTLQAESMGRARRAAEVLRAMLLAPQPRDELASEGMDTLWDHLEAMCQQPESEGVSYPHTCVFDIFCTLALHTEATGSPSRSVGEVEDFLMDMLCDLASVNPQPGSADSYLRDQCCPPEHPHTPGYTQGALQTQLLIRGMYSELHNDSNRNGDRWMDLPACLRRALRTQTVSEWPKAVVIAASRLPRPVPQPWLRPPPHETMNGHPLVAFCVRQPYHGSSQFSERFVHAGLTGSGAMMHHVKRCGDGSIQMIGTPPRALSDVLKGSPPNDTVGRVIFKHGGSLGGTLQVQLPPGNTALHRCFAVDPCWSISATTERILPLVEHTLAQLTQTRRKVDGEPSAVEAIAGPPDEDVAAQDDARATHAAELLGSVKDLTNLLSAARSLDNQPPECTQYREAVDIAHTLAGLAETTGRDHDEQAAWWRRWHAGWALSPDDERNRVEQIQALRGRFSELHGAMWGTLADRLEAVGDGLQDQGPRSPWADDTAARLRARETRALVGGILQLIRRNNIAAATTSVILEAAGHNNRLAQKLTPSFPPAAAGQCESMVQLVTQEFVSWIGRRLGYGKRCTFFVGSTRVPIMLHPESPYLAAACEADSDSDSQDPQGGDSEGVVLTEANEKVAMRIVATLDAAMGAIIDIAAQQDESSAASQFGQDAAEEPSFTASMVQTLGRAMRDVQLIITRAAAAEGAEGGEGAEGAEGAEGGHEAPDGVA